MLTYQILTKLHLTIHEPGYRGVLCCVIMARVTEKLDTQIPSSVLFYLAWQGEDLKVDRNAAATKPEMYIKKILQTC